MKKSQNTPSFNDIGPSKARKAILSHDQRKVLDKRYKDHQNGIGQSFTWEETIAMARELQKIKTA